MAANPRITRTDQHEQLIRMMRIDRRQLSSRQAPLDKVSEILDLSSRLGLPISFETLRGVANNPNGFFGQFSSQGYSDVISICTSMPSVSWRIAHTMKRSCS
ncbi:hypothetical protein [Moraxella ovis]|uniref:hypothetical protein n=1 Tax=Moraxella ovis TaxID=29433 RepID=UPI00215D91D3|nr:hypothetical protein [Moraxella ovis]